MTTDQIYERVREIVAWHARCQGDDISAEHIRSDDPLSAHGVDDELDCAEILMRCEEEFGIKLRDDLVSSAITVGDLVGHVAQHMRERDQIDADADEARRRAEEEYAIRTRAAELGLDTP